MRVSNCKEELCLQVRAADVATIREAKEARILHFCGNRKTENVFDCGTDLARGGRGSSMRHHWK